MPIDMTVSFPGGKKVAAAFEGFTVVTDQSEKNGGQGSAPEPLDLLFASLATCSGALALAFCESRDIDTKGMKLRLHADKGAGSKLFDSVQLELTLPAGFPEKYRKAIGRAVDQCAVKKHIEGTLSIATAVV